MKIEKYNENTNNIIINKTNNKILLDAMVEYDRVGELIKDFINFEKLIGDDKIRNVVCYYYEKNVEEMGDKILFVVFGQYEDRKLDIPSIMIDNEYEEKLHEFIQDPNLYMSAKKYNL